MLNQDNPLRSHLWWWLLLFPQMLLAQWGDIPPEMLQINELTDLADADAVVLHQEVEVRVVEGALQYQMEEKHYLRIKILTQAGIEQANVSIPFSQGDNTKEYISRLDARTHFLDEEGTPQISEVKNRDIYEQNPSPYYAEKHIAFPNAQVGAILEYRYTILRDYIFSYTYFLQREIPVLFSQLTNYHHERFAYASVYQGADVSKLEREESKEFTRWQIRNLLALEEEPYVGNLEDYRSKIVMQLAEYFNGTQGRVVKLLRSWETFTQDIYLEKKFGRFEKHHKDLRNLPAMLPPASLPAQERIARLHRYVARRMDWNGTYRIFTEEDVDDLHTLASGSSAEINLVLLNLLREAGFEAHPLLISTREHGRPIKVYPLIDQFNSLLAYVKHGDQYWVLDATDPLRPHDLLPPAYLNTEGWLLDEDNPRWVEVPRAPSTFERTMIQATLAPDGTLSGKLYASFSGYKAYQLRQQLIKDNVETAQAMYLGEDWPKEAVRDLIFTQVDTPEKPLQLGCTLDGSSFVIGAGERLYFNPMLAFATDDNPFTAEKRLLPIDFIYPKKWEFAFILSLPEDESWTVEEKPQSVQVHLPNEDMSLLYTCEKMGNELIVGSIFRIERVQYEATAYQQIQRMFTELIKREGQQVVLRRAAPVGESPSSSSEN